jgi:hypothetical protein
MGRRGVPPRARTVTGGAISQWHSGHVKREARSAEVPTAAPMQNHSGTKSTSRPMTSENATAVTIAATQKARFRIL